MLFAALKWLYFPNIWRITLDHALLVRRVSDARSLLSTTPKYESISFHRCVLVRFLGGTAMWKAISSLGL